uniref:Uncharacterized protein n=1 Tax=Arundo donax TaxID=35708 RepID=A0A0A9BY14_ARUDO
MFDKIRSNHYNEQFALADLQFRTGLDANDTDIPSRKPEKRLMTMQILLDTYIVRPVSNNQKMKLHKLQHEKLLHASK